MISSVKKLLNITSDDDDSRISLFCIFTTQFVKNYCKLREIPEELESIIAFIASNLYMSYEGHSKITIGDMSLEFEKDLKFYKNILNDYRRVHYENSCV